MLPPGKFASFLLRLGPTPKRSRSGAPLRGASLRPLARAAGAWHFSLLAGAPPPARARSATSRLARAAGAFPFHTVVHCPVFAERCTASSPFCPPTPPFEL